MITRATQKQAQEYKEKKVKFFKEFVEDVEGSAKKKKHQQPAAAPASASDELLKVDHCYCYVHGGKEKEYILVSLSHLTRLLLSPSWKRCV
jgi:hypothetical protein